jgi:hypothetical protein
MRLAFPAPLLGAAAALVFLYVEDNPIWGGTLASTLTGEFSQTWGIGFAVLFLGVLFRARADGRGPWLPAAALALACYAHGYAVLWAGLTASALLLRDPAARPGGGAGPGRWRTLGWLLAVAALAFAFAAPALLPLLAEWGWTTPYHDPWIEVTTRGLFPALLWPLFSVAGAHLLALLLAAALPASTWLGRRRGALADPRVVLLLFGAAAGAALAAAGPALGVVDVRFVPLAQLALAVAGAAGLGLALARLALADVAALGLVLLATVHADARSVVLRQWIDWNYSGLEAKELWPAWRELNDRLRGGPGDPRVAFEYSPVHERAGSLRVHETVPLFSGRSGIEGVYNQSSTTTHPVYYLLSELFPSSPNPFRSLTYSRFDPEAALARLPLLNVGRIVAVSPGLVSTLDARGELVREATIPPYTLYRLALPPAGYVEPVAFSPVRSPAAGWREVSMRWFSRKPPNRAVLVFTDDPRFDLEVRDPWAPPPERALPGGVEVEATVEAETIRVATSRPGHPLLVKVSFHPRWKAEGADGPYLASPGFMLVVPRGREVVLRYAARAWPDHVGAALALAAAAGALLAARRRTATPVAPAASGEDARRPLDRLPAVIPLALLAALAALRLLPPSPPPASDPLEQLASRAYAEERWEDAAEYARHAVSLLPAGDPRRAAMLCVRGEALSRAGHPREAVEPFALVAAEGGPHRPQALYSGALARERAGDAEGAGAWREALRAEHPDTPWAARLAGEAARPGP